MLLVVAIGWTAAARAEVTRVDIVKRGEIGQSGYEKISGTIHFAVDPRHPRNAVVVDLDKAPRTAAGRVEFSADLYIVQPKDPARGNGSVLVEVPNRGQRSAIRLFNRGGPSPDPESDGDLGDKFLMRFGFTLAWVGWDVDVTDDDPALMRLTVPAARAAPPNAGLGFIAMRDFATWLKHERRDTSSVRQAIGYGGAQSGRFLGDFLHQGFNTDERDRQVFDGVMAHVAGATRIGAIPGGNPPKVFCTNTPVEYWSSDAALVHTAQDGSSDLPLANNVRVYFLAGMQHTPARFPPGKTTGQQLDNPLDYIWVLRALLLGMHRWVNDGTAPPPSAYPMLQDGTLVKVNAIAFPAIPGVALPARASAEPRLVPAIDEDGNERAGIRMPDVAMPVATYTGWNLRDPSSGAPHEFAPLVGSWIPFPATKTARESTRDPRRSVAERYESRDAYLARAEQVTDALVLRKYILIDDVPRILQRTSDTWDLIMDAQR